MCLHLEAFKNEGKNITSDLIPEGESEVIVEVSVDPLTDSQALFDGYNKGFTTRGYDILSSERAPNTYSFRIARREDLK